MSVLEIRHRSGLVETRTLSKDAPLLVGQLPSSDLCVDADGVAPIHCRISWNRKHFEVAAVSPDGVQFNGITVQTSPLTAGDVIRVGDVDIVLLADSSSLDDDATPRDAGPDPQSVRADDPGRSNFSSVSQAELVAISADSLPVRQLHNSLQPEQSPPRKVEESTARPQARPVDIAPAGESRDTPSPERRGGMSRAAQIMLGLDEPEEPETKSRPFAEERSTFAADKFKPSAGLPKVRPGEQDPLRSPLVIGLSLGALLLVLSAATIWFVLSREKAQRQFEAAQSQLRAGQFAEAILGFEQFVRENPRHKLAPQARAEIGTARVEQAIAGASPAWDKGLEALQRYIDEN